MKRKICLSLLLCTGIVVLVYLGEKLYKNIVNKPKKNKLSEGSLRISELKEKYSEYVIEPIENRYDTMPIPDAYNTGCKEEKLSVKVKGSGIYQGIYFKESGEDVLSLDFFYQNKNSNEIMDIRDLDFTNYSKVALYNATKVISTKKVRFTNCKFNQFSSERIESKVSFEFKDCSFTNIYGSNILANNCYFGGTVQDAMNPILNATFNNCYISNLSHYSSQVIHSDGTQIYGYKDVVAGNIYFNNCRYEVPNILYTNNLAKINTCIGVMLEFSDAAIIHFNNCIINGGGYSIYATTSKGYIIKNILFNNIQVGSAKLYGDIYPRIADGVSFHNVTSTSSLFVGSVWKDKRKVYFSVTNDTSVDRVLIVQTNRNVYRFEIPAFPNMKTMKKDSLTFDDLPIDKIYSIEENPKWIVCYDGVKNNKNQIRFVNWSKEKVYIWKNIDKKSEQGADDTVVLNKIIECIKELSVGLLDSKELSVRLKQDKTIIQGRCGTGIEFFLSQCGVLVLSGSGSTYNYHSKKATPWDKHKSSIVAVIVEEGIENLGNGLFERSSHLERVSVGMGVSKIGSNVFNGCGNLKEISFPKSLKTIGSYAFNGTKSIDVLYDGTDEEWGGIVIGIKNGKIDNAKTVCIRS